MANREKVFDDPLAAFAAAPAPAPTNSAPSASAAAATLIDDSIRTVNTDKVTLKQKPVKAAVVKESVESIFEPSAAPASTVTKESKGLGFGVSLWDNQPTPAASITGDVLSNASSTTFESGIFAKKAGDAIDVPKYSKPKAAEGSRFRVAAEENDDSFEDLKVGKLVEREDTESDALLFGKTNVIQGAKGVVETKTAFSKARRDDFDLVSNDTIANLETATVERKAAQPSTVFTAPSFLDATVTQADEVDLSSLDINAYINQNSSSAGGLFD